MPYYDRARQLENTLISFRKWYEGREDYEVVVIEEGKGVGSKELHDALLKVLGEFKDVPIRYLQYPAPMLNSAPLYNWGVAKSNGEFLVLTNPECLHMVDILSELDKEFEQDSNCYVICACESLKKDGEHHMWYQHSKHRNKQYHFCSALSLDTFNSVGGFPGELAGGYCYEDDAFLLRVKQAEIRLIIRDDLFVQHQWHEKNLPKNWRKLFDKNETLYHKMVANE